MAKFCPNCGSGVKAKDKFCQACGTALGAPATTAKTKSRARRTLANKSAVSVLQTYRSPTLLWLAGGLAALLLVLLAVVLLLPDRGQNAGPGALSGSASSEEGDTAYFGAEISDVTPAQADERGLGKSRGVLVATIVDQGPAQKAGLEQGDVIIEIAGEPVAGTTSFLNIVSGLKPDSQTSLRILRGSEWRVIEMTLGAFLRDRVSAANAGDVMAMRSLAYLFLSDRLGPPDPREGLRWLRKAADAGDAESAFDLADRHDNGKGVNRDKAEAAKWYRKAADHGHAPAQYNLALLHRDGQGVERNHAKSAEWFRKAADQNYPGGVAELATAYGLGQGVEKNDAEAVRLHRKAVELGSPLGMRNLGIRYVQGRGVPEDVSRGAALLQRAAAQGDSIGMHSLGWLHAKGLGVEQDPSKAAQWVVKALRAGEPFTVSNLQENHAAWGTAFLIELQRLLGEAGVYRGRADGNFNADTMRAIRALAGPAAAEADATARTSGGSGPDYGNLDDLGTLD